MKWFWRVLSVSVFGFLSFAFYDYYRGGYFSLPDLEDGAFPISFQNGLRGIVYEVEVSDESLARSPKYFRRLASVNKERRYLGVPMDVPRWFEDTWSTCRGDDPNARDFFEKDMPEELKRDLSSARFEALCYITTDDNQAVVRGGIYSVPRR